MGKLRYQNVPLVKQVGDMSCGIACVEMLYLYKARQSDPKAKIPKAVKGQLSEASKVYQGVPNSIQGVIDFGKAFELRRTYIDSSKFIFSDGMKRQLEKAGGPIWYAGMNMGLNKATQGGHVVVITGIDGDKLYFNDPWKDNVGKDRQLTIGDFFAKLNLPATPWPVLYL